MAVTTIEIKEWNQNWAKKGVWVYIDSTPKKRDWDGTYYRFKEPSLVLKDIENGSSIFCVVYPQKGRPIATNTIVQDNKVILSIKYDTVDLPLVFWHNSDVSKDDLDKKIMPFWEE